MTATKEKEITLEMPLSELLEIRELSLDVSAFSELLNKLVDSEPEIYPLTRFFESIDTRFDELMSGRPGLARRISDAAAERGGA